MSTSLDRYLARHAAQDRHREFVGIAVIAAHRLGLSRTPRNFLEAGARMFRGCRAHRDYLAVLAALRGEAVIA